MPTTWAVVSISEVSIPITPPNSIAMIQGGGFAAMGAKKSHALAAELFTAPTHVAAHPPITHAD